MRSGSLVIRKATVLYFAVAFFFVTDVSATPQTETYKNVIEKAFNLSLQRDRTQAVSILLSALKRESKKSKAPKELQAALNQVATVFYSEKAQQLYELALSFQQTDTGVALSKLQEASRLEPENVSIELGIARIQLMSNDCDAALKTLNRNPDLGLYLEEIQLGQAQAFVCLGQFDDYLNIRPKDVKKSSLATFWHSLEAEYLFKTGAFDKVLTAGTSLQTQDASFPESSYWLWKATRSLKQKAEKPAQKYLSQCKSLSTRLQRQYQGEPMLCRRTAEVETFLKKNNNSEI